MESIGVVGLGTMGRGIARVFAAAGHPVVVADADPGAARAGLEALAGTLERDREAGRIDQPSAAALLERIRIADTAGEVAAQAVLVVEAVPEELDVKRAIFAELDGAAGPETILATNTSALPVTAIAEATSRPQYVLGLHFFNPAHRMPLVEVVLGRMTSEETLRRAEELCRGIGKETVRVKDSPGFATSRLSALLGNEAMWMLMEGVASAEDIDRAARLGLNHPMGPLELGDLVGLDTRLRVLEHLHRALGEKFQPCPLLVEYVRAGRLGRKTGHGVYRYDEQGARLPAQE